MGLGNSEKMRLKNNFNLFVIGNKNKKPIDKIVSEGAIEVQTYEELCANKMEALFICVTNTSVAKIIAERIAIILNKEAIVIDITTHNQNGSIEMDKIFLANKINYIECPVMGGPLQSEEGILGGIVGASGRPVVKKGEKFLKIFCKEFSHFGPIGHGSKAKLLSNFLSIGTSTFVIEMVKCAEILNINLEKLFTVSKLGSGNSAALNRIFDKALKNDYTGIRFSTSNTHKDLTAIHDMLKNIPNAEKLASVTKQIYKEAINKGHGNLFISELIKK